MQSTVPTAGTEGRKLGDFIVRERLGQGAFGAVYRAEQPLLQRDAVIKVLHQRGDDARGDPRGIERFLREARLASRLDHPYAAHIYAFGAEPDGLRWIAMELVRGTALDQLLRLHGPLPLDRFVPFLERLCEVVHTAHEQGIVHRDIKPANVMVISRAGRLLPKLCDLGIAKLVEQGDEPAGGVAAGDAPGEAAGDDAPGLTQRGQVIGSPLYMAPEQWADAAVVDGRTDLYALGVLAYEALTGQVPFPGATRLAVARAHATRPPPSLGPRFPPELDAVIARALAKRPADRHGDALELATEFRAASGLAVEPVALPQLDDAIREAALAGAPQPIADAVALLEAARNAHQARDALGEIVRAAVRMVGIVALAARSGVGPGGASDAAPVVAALRALRRRALTDEEWLELARELVRPFAAHPDAHPVPELVTAWFPRGAGELADPFAAALARRATLDRAGAAGAAQLRELLAEALADVARLLDALAFLHAYPLVVVQRGAATRWMGARRSPRATLAAGAPAIPEGRAILVDAGGRPLVALWPLVQLAPPMPGADDELFFLDGNARRGARLVALPGGFEHQDDELWTWFGEHLLDTADEAGGAPAEPQAPYLGLAAFGAGDAANYVGREREVEHFVNRLRVSSLLAVVGPSGVGKSSFVHAGVVPSLPGGWRAIALRPGAAPLAALHARLVRELPAGAALPDGDEPLAAGLRAAVPPGQTLVVIVDQFEELFTLGSAPGERVAFAAALAAIARAADDPLRVVVALRDDFLMRAEQLAPLRERLPVSLELLGVPAAGELRRIVVEPARRAGYDFDDPAVVDEMVAAVAGQPGALPLLSFTAAELWKRRNRHFRQLAGAAYRAIGGVGGALADHAEAVRARLVPEEQRLLREAFRHLVTAEGTRAVVTRGELVQLLGGGAHAETVIEQLVGGRLLVATDGERGEERIEVIHESLLAAWPRLAAWRREDTEGARLRDQLRAAARQWDERGRPRSLVWRDELLAEYQRWRARMPGALTAVEEAFGAASLADAARGRRIRRTAVITAFAILAAGMAVLLATGVAARRARARAELERHAAVASSEESHRRLLDLYVEEGRERAAAGDPLRGLVYLAEAYGGGARGPGLRYLIGRAREALAVQRGVLAHDDVVWSAAFSPDGDRVVTASADRTARIWRAATGERLATLTGHGDAVSFAAFVDGGVVTAGFDGRVGVWRDDGAPVGLTQGHTGRIWRAALSPDRRRLVTAGWDGLAIVWDTATGRPLVTLRGHTDKLWSAAFSADGYRVITAGLDRTARIWDAASGALLATLAGHGDSVRFAGLSADGALAVTASADGTARLWDAATGAPRAVLAGHRGKVNSARLSPDGTRVLTASEDGTAKIWALDGRLVHSLDGHHGYVSAALWRGDGATIVTASGDQTARLWDATTGRALGAFVGHVDGILAAELGPGGGFATAGEDDTARLWDPDAIRRPIALVGHVRPETSTEAWSGGVFAVAFSRDGARVWTSGDDATVRLWDARDGRLLRTIATGAAGPAAAGGFSADDTRFVTVGPDGATLWDGAAGRPLRAFAARDTTDAQLSPDGAELATAHGDGKARIVDVASGAVRVALAGHAAALTAVRWSADGRRVVTTSDDRTAIVWDARRGTRLATLTGHHLSVLSAAFSLDGAHVVTASRDKTARLWDAATGRALSTMDGHNQEVNAAAFSPDGTMIVTAGADAIAKLWDRATGKEIDSLVLHGRAVECVAFSRDGTRVVTGAWDDLAAIWTLPAPAPDAAQVEHLVRCEVPFELVDGKLFRSGTNPAACLNGRGR